MEIDTTTTTTIINIDCILGPALNPDMQCTSACELLEQYIYAPAFGTGTCLPDTHQCVHNEGSCIEVSPTGSPSTVTPSLNPTPETCPPGCDSYAIAYGGMYLSGYPPSAHTCRPSGCTFEEAKAHCDTLDDCSGVTLDRFSRYTVRAGSTLLPS